MQTQQRLTPLQVRYVRLLEMNDRELTREVESELDANPALEAADAPSAASETHERLWGMAAPPHTDSTPYMAEDSESLLEHLERQLDEHHLDERQQAVASFIIGSIDSNGYLNRSARELADDMAFGTGIDVSSGEAESALQLVRSLDPAGIGASSLQDSLTLQLQRMPQSRERDDALRIVTEAFDAFAMKHTHKLISRLKIDSGRVSRAVELILSLNPKPAAAFGSSRTDLVSAVVPDFVVEPDDEGKLNISIPSNTPELAIERGFDTAVKLMKSGQERSTAHDASSALFIHQRWQDARNFIALLRQRNTTLMSVMTALVDFQHEFFITGDEQSLIPLAMRQVAEKAGVDVSTVSRAVAGKYVSSTAGVYPLKYFFSERLAQTSQGEPDVSARSVQAQLRTLISTEDKRHPLSDDALSRELLKLGYEVSRRTVAKYRDRMGLPVARLRKNL